MSALHEEYISSFLLLVTCLGFYLALRQFMITSQYFFFVFCFPKWSSQKKKKTNKQRKNIFHTYKKIGHVQLSLFSRTQNYMFRSNEIYQKDWSKINNTQQEWFSSVTRMDFSVVSYRKFPPGLVIVGDNGICCFCVWKKYHDWKPWNFVLFWAQCMFLQQSRGKKMTFPLHSVKKKKKKKVTLPIFSFCWKVTLHSFSFAVRFFVLFIYLFFFFFPTEKWL